jgi:hypothetical protein
MIVNWKLVGTAGCALLLSGVVTGFLEAGGTPQARSEVLAAYIGSTLVHFSLYSVVFCWIGYSQRHRPVVHAVLAYIMAAALAVSILALLEFLLSLPPTTPQPILLQAIDWAVALTSATVGLWVGRRLARRLPRAHAHHDA